MVTHPGSKCIVRIYTLRVADLLHCLYDPCSLGRPRLNHCRFPNHIKIESQRNNASSVESQRLKLLSKKDAWVVIPFNFLVWPVHKMDESEKMKMNYYNESGGDSNYNVLQYSKLLEHINEYLTPREYFSPLS